MSNIRVVLFVVFLSSVKALDQRKELDVFDDHTVTVVQGTIKLLDQRSNSMYAHRPLAIKNAFMTLKSEGLLQYQLEFKQGQTSCRKGDMMTNMNGCVVTRVQECSVTVTRGLSFDNELEVADFQCSPYEAFQKTVLDRENKDLFEEFKLNHGKVYKSDKEEQERYAIFASNMEKARKLQRTERGTAVYGATSMADLTEEEFRRNYLGLRRPTTSEPWLKQAQIPNEDPPAAFDWRDHNAVTPVKNQGSCGSCWAFSVTGNVEGQYSIAHNTLFSLSEQELVDCDKLDSGCNGGYPYWAYKEIMRLGGLEMEKDYPYDGKDEKCHFNSTAVRVTLTGALNISKNESDMQAWLYRNGPISIGINAFAMQFYMGGVSHPWKMLCSPGGIDHGVVIVGYGTKKGWFSDSPYWIVKNSWGTGWGEKGYYLVYRGDGTCGLNLMASSAVVG